MKLIFLLLIIDLVLLVAVNVIYLELGGIFDLLILILISFVFMLPFIAYGIIKLLLSLLGKKEGKLIGALNEKEIMYKFARYLWEHYNFDIYIPNHIYGDKGKNSKYRYIIKYHRCYPAEIEKICLEIPDTIKDSHVFKGLETKVLLYFNNKGEIDDDRTMNDDFGWNDELLAEPLNLYIKPPSKTEKAEKLLEKYLKEKEEIPEELLAEAIREEMKTTAT